MQTEGQKLTPLQESDFLRIVAHDIAEREHLPSAVSLNTLRTVCIYYNAPVQQTALSLYFYLRNCEENRALVHHFREQVQSESMEREDVLKSQIRTLLQKPAPEWKEGDPELFQEALFDLQALGWRATYPGPGQVAFERIEVASRSEAVALGYVEE